MGWVATSVAACAVMFSSGTVVASIGSREERVRGAPLNSLAEGDKYSDGASKWWLLNGTNGVSGLNPCKPGVCVAVQDVACVGDCEALAVKYSADHPSQPCVTFTWHDNSVPCCSRELVHTSARRRVAASVRVWPLHWPHVTDPAQRAALPCTWSEPRTTACPRAAVVGAHVEYHSKHDHHAVQSLGLL
jgi:hypothetical protein